MKELFIVTYYVWDTNYTESLIYEVLLGSEFVCMDFIHSHTFTNDRHGFGLMPLSEYLSQTGCELDDVLSNISNFRI